MTVKGSLMRPWIGRGQAVAQPPQPRFGSSASRSPSPSTFSEMTSRKIAQAGAGAALTILRQQRFGQRRRHRGVQPRRTVLRRAGRCRQYRRGVEQDAQRGGVAPCGGGGGAQPGAERLRRLQRMAPGQEHIRGGGSGRWAKSAGAQSSCRVFTHQAARPAERVSSTAKARAVWNGSVWLMNTKAPRPMTRLCGTRLPSSGIGSSCTASAPPESSRRGCPAPGPAAPRPAPPPQPAPVAMKASLSRPWAASSAPVPLARSVPVSST